MKVIASLDASDLQGIASASRLAEEIGYDTLSVSETNHNPFIPMTLAAEHTSSIELQTSIALAFPRSPMDMSYITWDLQRFSNGRFQLGLGSQVRGHIVRRFSGTWADPAERMKEYILAMRSTWDVWQNGGSLEISGNHYRINLMPPFFNPGSIQHPDIKVFLAAVNPRMLRVAGELCEGVILHTFNTLKYTIEVILPSLDAGATKSGRTLDDIEITGGGFIVTGSNDEEIEKQIRAAKTRIAFYASTKNYSSVMEIHNWGEIANKLYRMSKEGKWEQMSSEITDEMLDAFVVIGDYDHIVERIRDRFGGYASSVLFPIPAESTCDKDQIKDIVNKLHCL